jgi:nitroreductase
VVIVACIDKKSIMSQGNRMKELREANAFVDTPLDKAPEASEDNYKKRAAIDENAIKSYLTLNAAIAIDHITLKATDLGLGTCWVMMFDKEKLHNMLNLEERYEAVALIPVGYPGQYPAQRPRLSQSEIILKEI